MGSDPCWRLRGAEPRTLIMLTLSTDWIGSLAAVLTTVSFAPQASKTWRTRDVRGISLVMYTVFTVAVALWLVYGLMLGDKQLGDFEGDRARAGVPLAFAVAAAAVEALGTLLVVAGAAAALDIEIHQSLGHELHHLAQHVDIGALVSEFE